MCTAKVTVAFQFLRFEVGEPSMSPTCTSAGGVDDTFTTTWSLAVAPPAPVQFRVNVVPMLSGPLD